MYRHRWCTAAVFLLLWEIRLSSAFYRIYISREALSSYYENTTDFQTVSGRYVNIMESNEVFVQGDGSLLLSGEGSGMTNESLTGEVLPPLPSTVNEITITWQADTEVLYELHVEQQPSDVFMDPEVNVSLTGAIPLNKTGFSIHFPCQPSSSTVTGKLSIGINTTTSDGTTTGASFFLEKSCEGFLGSISGIPPSIQPTIHTAQRGPITTSMLPPSRVAPTFHITPSFMATPVFPMATSSSVTSNTDTELLLPSTIDLSAHTADLIATRVSSMEIASYSQSESKLLFPLLTTSVPVLVMQSPATSRVVLTESETPTHPSVSFLLSTYVSSLPTPTHSITGTPISTYATLLPTPTSAVIATSSESSDATPLPSLAAVPTSSLAVVPTSSLAAVPTSSLAEVPTSSLAEVPTSSLAAVPTSSLAEVPTSSLAAVPTSPLAAVPTSSLAAVPTSSLAAVPTSSQAAVPTSSLAAVPTSSLAASSLAAVPTSTLAAVPTSSLAAVPTSSLAAVPTSSLAAVPASSLAASSLSAVPTSFLAAVPTSSLAAVPTSSLAALSLAAVPASSLAASSPAAVPTSSTRKSTTTSVLLSPSSRAVSNPSVSASFTIIETQALTTPTITPLSAVILDNSLRVILDGYSKATFNGIAQLDFTTLVADAATEYCAVHVEECGAEDLIAKRDAYTVEPGDVMIANINENNEDKVTFLLYIVVSNGGQVLAGDALESLVQEADLEEAGFGGTYERVTEAEEEEEDTEPDLVMTLIVVFAPVVGVLLVCITILCCFICVTCHKRRLPKRFSDDPLEMVQTVRYSPEGEEEAFEKKAETPLSLWMPLDWGTVSSLPQGIQGIIKHFIVDRRSLSVLHTIMRGEYGCIANGQLSIDRRDVMSGNKGIMIKMLIGLKEGSRRDEVTKFLEQATLLRGIEHPHVQSVLRVSAEDNCVPLVVYPFVEYGNMHNFLTLCRVSPEGMTLNPVTMQWKVNFSLQIATAMKFLSDNGIIHPDLALRNCLLDTNFVVKISDGALSHEFYPECYHAIYGAIRPVRWAAIETLQEGLCTSQSNVWSFGVTMWEVVTLAEMPYSEVDNNRSILSYLMVSDERLPQPDGCPENLYFLMSKCWKTRAEERPNFTSVFNTLRELYSKHVSMQNSNGASPHVLVTEDVSTFGKSLTRIQPGSIDPGTAVTGASNFHRRRSGGSYRNSAGYPRSNRSSQGSRVGVSHRDSQNQLQPEKISLTFSCLSGDMLAGTSESEGEMEAEVEPERSDSPPLALTLDMSMLRTQEMLGGITEPPLYTKPPNQLHSNQQSNHKESSTFMAPRHTKAPARSSQRSSRDESIPSTFMAPRHTKAPARSSQRSSRDESIPSTFMASRHTKAPAHSSQRSSRDESIPSTFMASRHTKAPAHSSQRSSRDESIPSTFMASRHTKAPAHPSQRSSRDESIPSTFMASRHTKAPAHQRSSRDESIPSTFMAPRHTKAPAHSSQQGSQDESIPSTFMAPHYTEAPAHSSQQGSQNEQASYIPSTFMAPHHTQKAPAHSNQQGSQDESELYIPSTFMAPHHIKASSHSSQQGSRDESVSYKGPSHSSQEGSLEESASYFGIPSTFMAPYHTKGPSHSSQEDSLEESASYFGIPSTFMAPHHNKTSSFSSQPVPEESSSYLGLPTTFMSSQPGSIDMSSHTVKTGDSSSTLLDTSSYAGHSNKEEVDDASSLFVPTATPSPDLVSKTSTFGDETMSTASNSIILPTATSSQANADTSSTLDLESVSTTVSIPYPSSSSQTSGLHALPGEGPDDLKPRDRSPIMAEMRTRGLGGNTLSLSPPGIPSKSTDSGIRSDEEADTNIDATQDDVGRDSNTRLPVSGARDSRTSRSSFGLGISDLSSDLMSAFDSWS